MNVGFFDNVYACNMRTTPEESRYKEECEEFKMTPDLLWSKMTSHEYHMKSINEWGGIAE